METDIKIPLRTKIYKKLVDDIICGRINAGEKLVEGELADQFKVSRTPVREALLQLEKEGYTEHVKNVGARVKKISHQKIAEIFAVIAVLESEAAEITTRTGVTAQDIAYLKKLQQDMRQTAENLDLLEYNQLNIRFHQFFLEKCGNETLQRIATDLRHRMYRLVAEGLSLPMKISEYIESHDNIIQAVEAKKPEMACRHMKDHIKEAAHYLVRMIIRRYE